MATTTLIGLYNYDNRIFDKIALPEVLDKDTVINAILLNCGEFEPLYPSPDAIKEAIGYWSKGKKHSWDKIAFALYHDYNPFVNFTRDEVRTIEGEYENEGTGKIAAWNESELQTRDNTETGGTSRTVDTFHSEGDSAMYTPTDVAKKETELRIAYDMIDIIIDSFKTNIVLAIY